MAFFFPPNTSPWWKDFQRDQSTAYGSEPQATTSSWEDLSYSIPQHYAKEKEINSLKNSLEFFEKPGLLAELDISLEKVRRKKIERKDHDKFLKDALKDLLQKSATVHPDKVVGGDGSQEAAINAHNAQSALNATRKILKRLTELFLEDIDNDYKYAYFANFEIFALASENEMKQQINNVLSRISMFSEIKRLNVIGQIRKFMLQSQECLQSYFERKEFETKIGVALYHLKKCIDGYENLSSEFDLLEKECMEEGDENMRSVIKKLAKQSLKESMQLRRLKTSAEESLKYSFEIFQIKEDMDEYFVLPFVIYLNVLFMCNTMFSLTHYSKKGFRSMMSGVFKKISCYGDYIRYFPELRQTKNTPQCYRRAYNLFRECIANRENISLREYLKTDFDKELRRVWAYLKETFKIDAYLEGKSNREKIAEEFHALKEEIENMKAEKECREKNLTTCQDQSEKLFNDIVFIENSLKELENKIRKKFVKSEGTNELNVDSEKNCPRKEEDSLDRKSDTKIAETLKQENLNKGEKIKESSAQNTEAHEEPFSDNKQNCPTNKEIYECYEKDMEKHILDVDMEILDPNKNTVEDEEIAKRDQLIEKLIKELENRGKANFMQNTVETDKMKQYITKNKTKKEGICEQDNMNGHVRVKSENEAQEGLLQNTDIFKELPSGNKMLQDITANEILSEQFFKQDYVNGQETKSENKTRESLLQNRDDYEEFSSDDKILQDITANEIVNEQIFKDDDVNGQATRESESKTLKSLSQKRGDFEEFSSDDKMLQDITANEIVNEQIFKDDDVNGQVTRESESKTLKSLSQNRGDFEEFSSDDKMLQDITANETVNEQIFKDYNKNGQATKEPENKTRESL